MCCWPRWSSLVVFRCGFSLLGSVFQCHPAPASPTSLDGSPPPSTSTGSPRRSWMAAWRPMSFTGSKMTTRRRHASSPVTSPTPCPPSSLACVSCSRLLARNYKLSYFPVHCAVSWCGVEGRGLSQISSVVWRWMMCACTVWWTHLVVVCVGWGHKLVVLRWMLLG